jgi:hypothetical protein
MAAKLTNATTSIVATGTTASMYKRPKPKAVRGSLINPTQLHASPEPVE